MPRVAEFAGICISIYAADHNPPHVHVFYGEFEALVVIASGATLKGDLPSKQLKMAKAWIEAHREMLQAKWDELNPPKK